jgi:hypothetical protein
MSAVCGDVLTKAPVRGVRATCVLEPDHKGYCRSKDGRAWERGTGNHAPGMTDGQGFEGDTSAAHDLLAVLAGRTDSLPDWCEPLLAPYRR